MKTMYNLFFLLQKEFNGCDLKAGNANLNGKTYDGALSFKMPAEKETYILYIPRFMKTDHKNESGNVILVYKGKEPALSSQGCPEEALNPFCIEDYFYKEHTGDNVTIAHFSGKGMGVYTALNNLLEGRLDRIVA